jgi:hypothetical protein
MPTECWADRESSTRIAAKVALNLLARGRLLRMDL